MNRWRTDSPHLWMADSCLSWKLLPEILLVAKTWKWRTDFLFIFTSQIAVRVRTVVFEPCFAFVLTAEFTYSTVFCILGIQSMPSCRVCLSQKQGKRAKILFASFRQSVGTIVSNPTPELCLFCSTYSRQHDFAWHGISMEQIWRITTIRYPTMM